MSRSVSSSPQGRVSVGEIAEIAGVRPSAVSNWRSRHADFPLPVERAAGGDLFDLASVIAWLEQKGRPYRRPEYDWDQRLWRAVDIMRSAGVELDRAVLVAMQWLYLRFQALRARAAIQPEALDLWKTVQQNLEDALPEWDDLAHGLVESNADLARALKPPPYLKASQLEPILGVIDQMNGGDIAWGAIASGLLERYQEAVGVRGTASTPRSIAELQVALLEPIHGSVYDPAAGVGMVLVDAWKQRFDDSVEMFGQEINEFSWRLAYLHLSLNSARFSLETGDTLRDDRFRSLRSDRIVLEPPLGMKPHADEMFADDRWEFGVPSTSADWLWAQHLVYHLSDQGVGVMTATLGALSRSGREEEIRRRMIKADLLDAVIELPPGMIAGTSIPVALLVFARDRRNRVGRMLFIDARQLGQSRRGRLHEFDEADVERIATTVRAWRDGTWEEEPRFAAAAEVDAVLHNRAVLLPQRYVQFSTRVTEIDGEAIEDRLGRLRFALLQAIPNAKKAVEAMADATDVLSGRHAEKWMQTRLAELLVAAPLNGTRQEVEGESDTLPYIQTGLVSGASRRLVSMPTEITRGRTRGRTVSAGDLLLTSRGITAESRIGCATVAFDGEAAYSESLLRLSPDPTKINPDYLRLFLTSRQGRAALFAATTGSTISNLRPDAVGEIEIPLPDLDTQQRIVGGMSHVEAGITELGNLIQASEDVYDTLREGIVAGLTVPLLR